MYFKLCLVIAFSHFLIPVELNDFSSLILNKRIEAFRKQFDLACDQNQNCTSIAIFATELCANPTSSPFCQTDCKFLIHQLAKLATNLQAIDDALTELPDDCSYKEKPHAEHSPEKCDDTDDGCQKPSNFKVELSLRMTSDGKIYIDDSNNIVHDPNVSEAVHDPNVIEAVHVESEIENYEESGCVLSETETLKVGEVSTIPCNAVYGEKYAGNALQFCSLSRTLLQSASLCIEPAYAPFQFSIKSREPMRTEPLLGVESLSKYKDDIEKASNVLGTVKKVLSNKKIKEFLPIAKKIASFLGPVGVAFQVILFFIPDGPDKKHEAIMSSLKTLEENTELIIQKIDKLQVVIRKEIQDSKLNDIVVKIQKLESSFKRYATNPTEGMKKDVYKACRMVSGDLIVEYYLNLFNSRPLMNIVEMYDFHRNEFMEQLGEVAIINSIRGMSGELKCFALESGVSQADIQHMANDLQPKLVKISEKIQQAYDDVIPKYAMNKQLEIDVKNHIKSIGGTNQNVANHMRSFLEKSYDFYTFGVIVQNDAEEYRWRGIRSNCFACVGANNPGALYVKNYSGKNVMVIYSNKERCIPTQALHYVNKIIVEFERPRLFRSYRNTQDMSNVIWDSYGSSQQKSNKPFNAIILAKYLEIGHTSQAPSNAIGIWFGPSWYKFFYVC